MITPLLLLQNKIYLSVTLNLKTIYAPIPPGDWRSHNGETIGTLTSILSPPTLKLWRTGRRGRGNQRRNNNELTNKECCHPES